MKISEYELLEKYFNELTSEMDDRENDKAQPEPTMVDRGYSLAVSHMKSKAKSILSEARKTVIE